jgi:hypothetical protein
MVGIAIGTEFTALWLAQIVAVPLGHVAFSDGTGII